MISILPLPQEELSQLFARTSAQYVSLHVFVRLCLYPYYCLSVCPYVCLSIHLFVCLSVRVVDMSVCTNFFCLSVRLSVWYGMVYVNLYSAIVANVSNVLGTLVPGKQPSFQALSEGDKVLLCAEVVRQRVPNHRAVHSECSAANS